jgi:hypothetical protein
MVVKEETNKNLIASELSACAMKIGLRSLETLALNMSAIVKLFDKTNRSILWFLILVRPCMFPI